MIRNAAIIAVAVAGVACGRARSAEIERSQAMPTQGENELRVSLAKLAWGRPPPIELLDAMRDEPIEAYIDALVASQDFAEYAAYRIVFGPIVDSPSEAGSRMSTLHSFAAERDGKPGLVHYLVERCDPGAAVPVRPWWDVDTEILVCPGAYQPTHVIDPATGWRCGSKNQTDQLRNLAVQRRADAQQPAGEPAYCGCGPSLMYCVADAEMRNQLVAALQREVLATVSQTIDEDRPFDQVFTGNATYRDRLAEFFYQRSRLLAGEIDVLPRLDHEPASLRSRPESWPGQHAGILTTYQFLHMTDGSRDRMRDYFAVAWCEDPGSHGATADQVLGLGVTDLRDGDGWRQLAAMPLCTTCHARLDYGMQFFLGFPSSYDGFFDSSALVAAGAGPLYGDDITDVRGHAELTPAGFASLLVSQPDYDRCIAGRVTRHVLGDSASADDVAALEKLFADTRRVKPVMRAGLLRFATRWRDETSQPSVASASRAGELRRMIDAYCIDCHDASQAGARNFDAVDLPRQQIAAMLDRVAWGDMPRSNDLGRDERDRMVRLIIDRLWPQGPGRESALRAYLGFDALSTHTAQVIRYDFSGARSSSLGLEAVVDPAIIQASPGVVAYLAASAAEACRDHAGDDFARCFAAHTSPGSLLKRRLR